MAKVVVLLSPAQRAKLLQIPDTFSERDITRYYSLSAEDLTVIEQHRRPQNRLGFTVQLAYLRFPGRPWDPQEQAPPSVLAYLAEQIGEAPDVLADYATRDPTRREHLSEIQRAFRFHPFTMQTYRDLSRWLMPIALSTDQGIVLMEALIEELRARHVVLPAVSTLERLGWETRRRAQQQVFTTLTQGLSEEQRKQLDALLVVPTDGRRTPLAWLREPPGPAKPSSFLKVIERLRYIRSFELDSLLARRVHANRLRRLVHEGEQYTPQFLERFEPLRRYATLVASLLDMTATLTDTALEMHDHIMGLLFKQGQKKHLAQFEQRGKAINEKVRLYADVGNALIKAKEEAADPYKAMEAVLPWETFVTSVQEARTLVRPADFDYLDLLDDHYSHIRKYAPELLETFTFHAAPSSQSVAEALTLVRDLGRKKVPENAPVDFVKPRWESHVLTDEGIDRHYYELCALSELRNGLRSGDIWVEGSHQYRQFEEYLLPTKDWQELRVTGTPPVAVPLDAATYLTERKTLLHEQLTRVGQLLKDNALPDVRIEKNKVRITPLDAEIPEGVEELARKAYAKVRCIKITQLLIEIDHLIHFSRHFTHLHSGEPTKDREALFASLLAEATNLGLTKMADATPGMTRTRLSWVSDWYVRDDCYTKALAEIVNYHHRLPFSANWGDGTTSSSDGQRFPVGGPRSNTAQINAKYSPEPGLVFYTHISDQLDPYRTKVITGTPHEAPHMIDGLLYHETDLDIHEHYADTGGYTDQVFSTCHLLGFRFAPRLRDLGDRKLYTVEKTSSYPDLSLLIGGTVNVKQITEHWDELLRLTASLRLGTVTASLMLRKLASYPRQNGLAWALREVGRIEKTLFTLEWFQSLELRRRVQVGLNKGEARNALARAVFFYRQGRVQDRSHAQQQQRAQGLNLVVAAIILWNTLELARAIEELQSEGVAMTAEQLRHLSPMDWKHIGLTGDYTWDFTAKNTRA
jgi:TnpA family transposase